MEEVIELGKWYNDRDLDYMAIGNNRGTNAIIRGDIHPVHEFVYQLDQIYMGSTPDRRILEHFRILKGTLGTGKENGDLGFGDDRIRLIRRLADPYRPHEGPLAGSPKHIEIVHNEQYGGDYPGNPMFSSRAGMIGKVLRAIQNMRPKEKQISRDLG